MVLVFLQNAYRKDGFAYKSREQWLKGMWASRTGCRLKEMLPKGIDVYVENASPMIGTNVNSLYYADLVHMQKVIDDVKPKLIVGCGKIAQEGLANLGVVYIAAPHPAWRALSKIETKRIADILKEKGNNG